ncbi:hypothetical protein [Cryobacterium sp. Y57]|uniref:hypothetical protein n=1 Tax=Cryobacterium sp. Y57 TaxID=2048287 RepID=UPI000CE40C22|nr:hypothetical protein [Cryobacterium sp. Y57]
MRYALVERAHLIESRASAVLDRALLAGEPWTRALGVAPRGSASVEWRQNGRAVAAYRDRHGIVGVKPRGAVPERLPRSSPPPAPMQHSKQLSGWRMATLMTHPGRLPPWNFRPWASSSKVFLGNL